MTIFGIPVVAILGTGLTVLGAYNCAKWAVSKIEDAKREAAHQRQVLHNTETAIEYAANAYKLIADPETRRKEVLMLADKLHTVLASAKLPIASQFEAPKDEVAPASAS